MEAKYSRALFAQKSLQYLKIIFINNQLLNSDLASIQSLLVFTAPSIVLKKEDNEFKPKEEDR